MRLGLLHPAGCAALASAVILAGCLDDDVPPPEVTEESTSELNVCMGDDVVHGIDVSYYQGDIDWNAVAGGGYGFAITRINHGTFMDPKFDQNWAAIRDVGMIRGAYQYFEPGDDVAWQAQVVIDKLGKLGPGDLPAVIDVETTSGITDPAVVAQAVGDWIVLVEKGTGKKPIIYTGKYFWQDNVQASEFVDADGGVHQFSDYTLWHAQYPNACQPPNAPPPACGCANIADQWGDVGIWQYSSSGSVPGIAGNVDMNVWKGTLDDLTQFANQAGYGAALLSIDAPSVVLAGEAFTARVTLANIGASAWDANTRLGTTEPRDRASLFAGDSWIGDNRAASVEGAVVQGGEYTFDITMRAPADVGAYQESFGMVQEAVAWFGDQGGPDDTAITMSFQVVEEVSTGAGGKGGGGGGSADDDGDDADGCSCRAAPGAGTDNEGAPFLGIWLALAAAFCRRKRSTIRCRSTGEDCT